MYLKAGVKTNTNYLLGKKLLTHFKKRLLLFILKITMMIQEKLATKQKLYKLHFHKHMHTRTKTKTLFKSYFCAYRGILDFRVTPGFLGFFLPDFEMSIDFTMSLVLHISVVPASLSVFLQGVFLSFLNNTALVSHSCIAMCDCIA